MRYIPVLLALLFLILSSCTYHRPLVCITKRQIGSPGFDRERVQKRGRYFCLSRYGIVGMYKKVRDTDSKGKVKGIQYSKMINCKIQDTPSRKRFSKKSISYSQDKMEKRFLIIRYNKSGDRDTIVHRTVCRYSTGKRTVINYKKTSHGPML